MSKPNKLQSENAKLRLEIHRLQNQLKEISQNSLPLLSQHKYKKKRKSPLASDERREFLRKEIEEKLCMGIFKPPRLLNYKKPQHSNSLSHQHSNDSIKFRDEDKHANLIQERAFEDRSKQEITLISEPTISPATIKYHIDELNIENPELTIKRSEINISMKEIDSSIIDEQRERTLKDSFDSYYESEQENIEKEGKCDLSYQDYENDHQRGSRRRERNLLKEIGDLREQNNRLREKLHHEFEVKERINPPERYDKSRATKCCNSSYKLIRVKPKIISSTGRNRSISLKRFTAYRSASTRNNIARSLTPTRSKHCSFCDSLLSMGSSTKNCLRHSKPPKQDNFNF